MRYLLLYLLLTLYSLPAIACSCNFVGNFCSYSESMFDWTEGKAAVVHVRYLGVRAPAEAPDFRLLYDFELIEVIAGEIEATERFTLFGQDGGNCNGSGVNMEVRKEYIILMDGREGYWSAHRGLNDIDNSYPLFDFLGCGVATLEVRGGLVRGQITSRRDQMSLRNFRIQLAECGVPLNEEVPTTVARPRLTLYPNPTTNWTRFKLENAEGVIRRFAVYDALGRTLLNREVPSDNIEPRLSDYLALGNLGPGVYTVVVSTSTGQRVHSPLVIH